ncbi:hypothetical protein PR048_019302 [Dryococelus australis]|uniref:DDE-1 domain-containing protein n=1 Tax=Dryococelus australis TaxID=614101 RepID=A0ABQ9H360_9NEOP|nr:hypothetical protein PR048_019302 [Dryococelus australis]
MPNKSEPGSPLYIYSHSSHKLKPLDTSFMHPLKTYFNEEIRTWLYNHRNTVHPITHYQLSQHFVKAYARAATLETAINGFRKSGIFSFNKGVFQDHDFIDDVQTAHNTLMSTDEVLPCTSQNTNNLAPPCTIRHTASYINGTITDPRFEDLNPLPTVRKYFPSNGGKKRSSAQVLTSAPNKDELLQAKRNKAVAAFHSVKRSLESSQPKHRPNVGKQQGQCRLLIIVIKLTTVQALQANVKTKMMRNSRDVDSYGP